MQVGKYSDGRPLNYDETANVFDVEGTPVTLADVVGYDQAGQVDWLTDDLREWARGFAAGLSTEGQMVEAAPDNPVAETKRRGLFGFRSRRPWKMVIASAYYVFCGLAAVAVFASVKPYATDTKDIVIDVVTYLIFVFALLSPAFLLSDFGYRERLPLFKRRKFWWSAVGLAVVCLLLVTTYAFADSLHTQPYKVAAEKERVALLKKQEAEAAAKRSAKASATAEAKRVADAKRSAEASAAAEAKRVEDAKRAEEQSSAVAAAPAPKPAPKQSAPQTVPYSIIKKEDLTFGGSTRYVWHVLIPSPATPEQLRATAKVIVERAKVEAPFNAFSVGFYDYPQYMGFGYTLGKVTFAPNGEWGDGNTVSKGDYSAMSYTYDIPEKDWSKRLTPSEVAVWVAWQAEYDKENALIAPSSLDGVDEAHVDAVIAKKLELSVESVKAIILKQVFW